MQPRDLIATVMIVGIARTLPRFVSAATPTTATSIVEASVAAASTAATSATTSPATTSPATTSPATTSPTTTESATSASLTARSPFLAALPGLKDAAAPDWVKPGVRLTYRTASAAVAGADKQFTPDPLGGWIDSKTDKRYSQTDVGTALAEEYTEVNIAALDDKNVAIDVRRFGYDSNHHALHLIGDGGGVAIKGAGAEYWINPDQLKKLADSPPQNMTVGKGTYKIKDKSYDAIWICSGSKNGVAWVYDAKTGALLRSALSARAVVHNIAGGRGPHDGDLLLMENTLVQLRAIPLPWAQAPAPPWIATVKLLDYEGIDSVRVPGAAPLRLTDSVKMEFKSRGPNWITCLQTTVREGSAGTPLREEQTSRVFGGAEIGGLWITPIILDRLRPGAQIDVDPITGITTTIAYGPHHNLSITEISAGMRTDYTYDHQTGVLVSYVHADQVAGTTRDLALKTRE